MSINKKIIIILGIFVAGFILILVSVSLNKESKRAVITNGVVTINSENDLKSAIGKQVIIRAKLYNDKLPILVFGKTPIYCWQDIDSTGKWSLCEVVNGPKRNSNQSIGVNVWGKLEKHRSVFDKEGKTVDQLSDGNYEIYVSRLEVDEEFK